MTTATEMQAKVDLTVRNMDRINGFANGGPSSTVTLEDGTTTVPSMRNIAESGFRRVAVPSTAVTAGVPGDTAISSTYAYFYTGDGTTHTWRRVAISSW